MICKDGICGRTECCPDCVIKECDKKCEAENCDGCEWADEDEK